MRPAARARALLPALACLLLPPPPPASGQAALTSSGFIGGAAEDTLFGHGIDTVGADYLLLTAQSDQSSFPVLVGPDLTFNGDISDLAVVKVRPDATGLVYAGFIGGAGEDRGGRLAVDAAGGVYLAAATFSEAVSLPLAVGPGFSHGGGGADVLVAHLDPSGTSLLYCGLIGGAGSEESWGIAIDPGGNAFVTAFTTSTEATLPTLAVGPELAVSHGVYDVLLTRVLSDGSGLAYLGYIGGLEDDNPIGGIVVGDSGDTYLAGSTGSLEGSFPLHVGPDLTFNGDRQDAFAARVKPDASGFLYAGYLGGDARDQAVGPIVLDGSRNLYVAGFTESAEGTFPVVVGPDLRYNGGSLDGWVARVDPSGAGLGFAGYIGGGAPDAAGGVAITAQGEVLVTGVTWSTESTFPVDGGVDRSFNGGAGDAFLAKVAADGSRLVFSGYIGGDDRDHGVSVLLDAAQGLHVAGNTGSSEATFPVAIGPDLSHNRGNDAFLTKLASALPCSIAPSPIALLKAVRSGPARDDVALTWLADVSTPEYNVWRVEAKADIPLATRDNQPPAVGLPDCAEPSPAQGVTCTDSGAVSLAPTQAFYQVRAFCAPGLEGP